MRRSKITRERSKFDVTKTQDFNAPSRLFYKKPWYKKWWGILIIVFLVIGFFGAILDNSPDNSQAGTQSENGVINLNNPSVVVYQGDPSSLLPNREEIATEWKISKKEGSNITATGFESGAHLEITRDEGLSASIGHVFVDKFDSADNAKNHYKNEVQGVKNEGGYTEISTSGIDAVCFAYKGGDYLGGYYYLALCQKDNIYFISEIDSFNILRMNYYKDLAKITGNKI